MQRSRSHTLVLAAGLAVAFIGGVLAYRMLGPAPPPEIAGFLWPNPKQLGQFELTDHGKQALDLQRVGGHWTLWYFGYTHCPDVCPTTLAALRGVERELNGSGPAANSDVQYVFVSVDPERDTPEHLAAYVKHFSEAFIGATGSHEQLMELTSQLGVLYVLGERDENGDYLVDHSSSILLTDPQRRLVGVFSAPQEPADIAGRVQAIREIVDAG